MRLAWLQGVSFSVLFFTASALAGSDFSQRFPKPLWWDRIAVEVPRTSQELSEYWRAQHSGSEHFKAAFMAIEQYPNDEDLAVNAINMLAWSDHTYPYTKEVLEWGVEHYFNHHSQILGEGSNSADQVADLLESLAPIYNRLGQYEKTVNLVQRLFRERGNEVNDHLTQLLSLSLADALNGLGQKKDAIVVLETALRRPKGSWERRLREKLASLDPSNSNANLNGLEVENKAVTSSPRVSKPIVSAGASFGQLLGHDDPLPELTAKQIYLILLAVVFVVWGIGVTFKKNTAFPVQFDAVKDEDEQILWHGQPVFVPYVISGFPLLVFGGVWGAIDFFIFKQSLRAPSQNNGIPVVLFLAIHSIPFWLCTMGFFVRILGYSNENYAITTKRLIFRSGFFGINFSSVPYDQIVDLKVNMGPVQRLFGVGTVMVFESAKRGNGNSVADQMYSILDPYRVFKLIQKTSVDIKTDWNYPNALRPQENPGYKTKYRAG